MRKLLSRLELVKFYLLIVLFFGEIVYHSTIRFRFWWERRRGREAEVEATIDRMVRDWAKRILDKIHCRVEVEGKEHVPPEGPMVVMTNHQSMFDILLLLSQIREVMGFVTKRELFTIPFFSFWMKQIHCVSLDRSDARSALALYESLSQQILEKERGFIIFPEGTRTKDPGGAIGPFKEGSLRLAILRELPILPVSLDGTRFIGQREAMYNTRHGGRLLRIKIGPLIPTKGRSGLERKKLMAEIRDSIETGFDSIRVIWPARQEHPKSGGGHTSI